MTDVSTVPEPLTDSTRAPVRLGRAFGIAFGVAIGVGSIIGAGILRSPSDVAAHLPNPWWFISVWIVGGLYALLGANSLAELGTMLPRSGGQYVYARHALGPYAGFLVGWNDWVSTCGSVAAIAIVIAESVGALHHPLAGHSVSVAVTIVLVFTLLLLRGSKTGDRTQQLTSLLKAIAFFALIAACFIVGGDRSGATPPTDMPRGLSLLAAFIIALQGVIFAYDGWTGVLYFSEEVHDPGRQIPRSLFGGLLAVIAIYLLINAAFLYVTPISAMATSTMVAATAAERVFGSHGDTLVRALVVVALPSAVTANLLMGSRVVFSMGRDGLATRTASRVNGAGTPVIALLLTALCAILFVLTGAYDTVIAILAFFFVASYAISFTSVFVLRRREPDTARPYRVWGYPWTTGIVLAGSIAFLIAAVASDTRNSGFALLLVIVSYPVYLALRRMTRT